MSVRKCLVQVLGLVLLFGGVRYVKGEVVRWRIEDGGNGHYYEAVAVPESITWEDANLAATAVGGYVATITSAEENDFVFGLVKDDTKYWRPKPGVAYYAGPWLGGFQYPRTTVPDDNWQWVTGETWDYTFWCPEYPNIPDDQFGDQNKLHFIYHSGGWNDLMSPDPRGRNPVAYIVEWQDTTPPEVLCTLEPDTLWPPNHKMVEVSVSILAIDDFTPNPEDLFDGLVVLVSSDEPDNGLGDGDTEGDVNFEDGFTVPANVTPMFTLTEDAFFEGTIWLRAERGGGGGGRTYTIEAFVKDVAGNVGSCSCEVKVPHDKGRGQKGKKK